MSTLSYPHQARALRFLTIVALLSMLFGAASVPKRAVAAVPTITWANPAPIVYGTPLSATQLNATAHVPGTFSYDPPAGTVLNAGNSQTLSAHFTPDDTATYDPVDATVTIDVTRAPLTITADDASKVYGGPTPAFTATSSPLVNGDTLDTLDAPLNIDTGGVGFRDVGTYPIVPHGSDANYDITLVHGVLTVTPAPLAITADDKIKKVGTPNPELTAHYNGFVNGDDETSLIPPVSLSTTATDASPVGDYPITPSGAVNPNYDITFVSGTLTIAPKDIPLFDWATPSPIVYGTALDATQLNATVSFEGNPVAGTFSYDPPAGTVLNAGNSQPLFVTFTPDDTATYDISVAVVLIDVTRAPLTITADNASKVYGDPLPTFSATASGFVNGESFGDLDLPLSLDTSATAGSDVGTYPIVPAAADPNYDITLVNGTLTVTPAPLASPPTIRPSSSGRPTQS